LLFKQAEAPMREKPRPKISRRMAERHEAFCPKLQKLARQVGATGRSSPKLAVPDAVRREAEALLFDVQPFREIPTRGALPVAAPHYGGLAAQLAEALTALLAFEQRHTQYNFLTLQPQWSVEGPGVMPVKRLAPRPGSLAAVRARAQAEHEKSRRVAKMAYYRAELARRLEQSER
jgi:hypothetical protein